MKYTFSQRLAHFFHVVSNIRPVVWIGLYVCITPIFSLIYWALPDGQFRVPDPEATGYGSWLYYSIVTITTLGFGDYTPAHGAAQAVTAIEVMCGLIFLGFFLNAVGSMKSEIDVESEIEKQKALHHAMESEKLEKSVPMVLDALNYFLAYCYAVTTPLSKRSTNESSSDSNPKYNPDFTIPDMIDMLEPSGLPFDHTNMPAVERLMHSASRTSLVLDSLQQRVDMTLWPELLEDCFAFVANYQMFSNSDVMWRNPDKIVLADGSSDVKIVEEKLRKEIAGYNDADLTAETPQQSGVKTDKVGIEELQNFIRESALLAQEIETKISEIHSAIVSEIRSK